jgi:hypothetical protein
MSDTPGCTRCDSTDVVPIFWGMPSPELVEGISTGEVDAIIGGCIVEEPSPTHECRRCGSRFADGEAWYFPPVQSVFEKPIRPAP